MKFKFFALLTSMVAIMACAGSSIAQTKKTPPANPKTEQNAPEGKQDAPPPRGPEGYGPGRGMGPRMGPGMQPGMGMGQRAFRPGQGGRDGFGPGKGMGQRQQRGPGMMFFGLGLTDDQKTKIQAIMKSAKPSDAQRDEMRSLMMAARSGLITEAQQTRMKAIRDEQRGKRESIQTQLMGALTPEQKGRLEERRAMQMRQRMQDRRSPNRRDGEMGPRKNGRRQGPGPDRQVPPPPQRPDEN